MSEPRRIRATIAYDGTDFEGWQIQPGKRTVQGDIEAALAKLAGRRVVVIGASRTDSGVHARGQVASFDLASSIATDRLPAAVNSMLGRDVRFLDCVEAPGFHARRDCVYKSYSYSVWLARIADPISRRFALHVPYRLELDRLRGSADALIGEIDLTAFALSEAKARLGRRGGVRIIREARWEIDGSLAVFHISADGFLRHSIRCMAGVMIEIARGRLGISDLEDAVRERSRARLQAPTLPARGLCLEVVTYTEMAAL